MLCALIPALPAQAAGDADVKVGDYVQMGMYYGRPILWRCVDIDDNGPLMLSDKILSVKAMDSKGNVQSGSHTTYWRGVYGSNYWPDSNICSWLNSTADAGNVEWTCGNPPDKDHVPDGYNAYDQEAGFLNNFTQAELGAIKEVTQKFLLSETDADFGTVENPEEFKYVDNITGVAANYDSANIMDTNDKMFLLNVKQLSAVYENRETLGDDYYIGEPTAECVENSEYKPDTLAVGQKWYYWLRTPFQSKESESRRVAPDGRITSDYSMNNMGIRPAFYLNQDVSFKTGNGTQKSILCEYDKAHMTSGTEPYDNYSGSDIKDARSNYDRAYAEYVTDKIFLPDVIQAYAVYRNGDILGADYYVGEPTAECAEHNEDKLNGLALGKKWNYALRTPLTNQVTMYYVVGNNGKVVHTPGYVSTFPGIRPSFYLEQDVSFKSGKGTQSYPYSISGDAKRVQFGGESDIELSATYGEGLTANLAQYVAYENQTASKGRFTYAIEGDNPIGASVKGETLTIPKETGAGDYTLTVKATEKASEYMLASVDEYGYEPVTLTINVNIAKIAPTATVQANELVYKNAEQYLVTGKADGGTLVYSLNDKDGEYSEAVPTGNDAGDYTVWYKVLGDDNHTDSEPQPITVSIKDITGIRIESEPENKTVIEGMPFDATGLKVIANCGNGETYEAFGYTLSGYDTSQLGEQTVTVTYGNKTATFGITVVAKTLTGIELTHKPDKLTYYQGDALDTAGMVVTASYDNNTSEVIDNEACTISELTDTVGEQTVTVTYNDKTVEFTVTVLEKPAPAETVETPLIETADFYGGKRAVISCATDGAEIYYTTDGTEPTELSDKYTASIVLTETTEIKAIAVKADMISSAVASATVEIEKVETPVASVPNGEVTAGTSVKLLCTTPGAEIYYTLGESLTEENYNLYTNPIVITEDTNIRVMAAKLGCAMSEGVTFTYTVAPPEEPSEQNRALIGVDDALAKAGSAFSLPIYMYYENGTVTDFRAAVTFDSDKFEYLGFDPDEGVPASILSVTAADGTVTVRAAGDGIQSGIACTLWFRAKSGIENDDYTMSVSGEINDDKGSLIDIYYWDGIVSVVPEGTSIVADGYLTDSEFNIIEDAADVKGDMTAWILAEAVDMQSEDESQSFDILLVFYDTDGALVTVSRTEAELYDNFDLFMTDVTVPESAERGRVKLMIWDELGTMKPLSETVPML